MVQESSERSPLTPQELNRQLVNIIYFSSNQPWEDIVSEMSFNDVWENINRRLEGETVKRLLDKTHELFAQTSITQEFEEYSLWELSKVLAYGGNQEEKRVIAETFLPFLGLHADNGGVFSGDPQVRMGFERKGYAFAVRDFLKVEEAVKGESEEADINLEKQRQRLTSWQTSFKDLYEEPITD